MHVIVPIKRYSAAKTRLSVVLAPAERAQLANVLAQTVLFELGKARSATSVQVVTREPAVAGLCRSLGFLLLDDRGADGLNAAVKRALKAASAAGIHRVAVVHADLPLFRASAFDAVTDAHLSAPGPLTTIVTDIRGDGTNLLLTTTENGLPCLYGPASANRHAAASQARGIANRIVQCPRLSVDCDWPEDLRHPAIAGQFHPLPQAAGTAS